MNDPDFFKYNAKVNSDYCCVIRNPPKPKLLKTIKWKCEIRGTFVTLPKTAQLFITLDGSVLLASPKKKKGEWHFETMDNFAKTVNNTVIIENFEYTQK